MDCEEDYGFVEPYDCNDTNNEPRPDSVVYQPVFADLVEKTNQAAALLREPLEESTYHNVITEGLRKEVIIRTQSKCSEEVKFAVAGDMAAGELSAHTWSEETLILSRKELRHQLHPELGHYRIALLLYICKAN